MAAGFVYNLKPKEVQEERYDVSTGVRRRGNYILDVAGLAVGSYVPSFLPIAADLKAKTAKIAVRALVVEASDTEAVKIKVAKNPYLKDGMVLGTGEKGATIQSVNRTNADYDEVTLADAFGAKVNIGDVLFEASAAGGTTPKAVANSALYENHKVTEGINSVALLMRAFEIEPEKLVMPFCAADKANLPHFQFNE
ncbi:head fiber protein [Bacteroides heparinolyticus]|uniref:head fiber protein n=1 Tax=Prevotella heparinolytica TaxID=28113 RepID=UPI0023F0F51B|nr:head fiber protein [Bacteroides heparinolyticus]